jgi:hypothetical protein
MGSHCQMIGYFSIYYQLDISFIWIELIAGASTPQKLPYKRHWAALAFNMCLFYFAGWIMDNCLRKFAIIPSFTVQIIAFSYLPFCSSFSGLLLVCLVLAKAWALEI